MSGWHECLAAADELAASGVAARVIDVYSVTGPERHQLWPRTSAGTPEPFDWFWSNLAAGVVSGMHR